MGDCVIAAFIGGGFIGGPFGHGSDGNLGADNGATLRIRYRTENASINRLATRGTCGQDEQKAEQENPRKLGMPFHRPSPLQTSRLTPLLPKRDFKMRRQICLAVERNPVSTAHECSNVSCHQFVDGIISRFMDAPSRSKQPPNSPGTKQRPRHHLNLVSTRPSPETNPAAYESVK
jgi:hypothetical protein